MPIFMEGPGVRVREDKGRSRSSASRRMTSLESWATNKQTERKTNNCKCRRRFPSGTTNKVCGLFLIVVARFQECRLFLSVVEAGVWSVNGWVVLAAKVSIMDEFGRVWLREDLRDDGEEGFALGVAMGAEAGGDGG